MTSRANETHIGQVLIAVEQQDLPTDVLDLLERVVVEDDLGQPAMFELRFHDQAFRLIDGTLLRPGAEVRISAVDCAGSTRRLLTGEITALESELAQHATVLTVRGYDRSHRLHRGRKTRTFLKQSDGDIAAQIAREAQLRADVEATSERHAYVMQDNQTDLEFLRARAARIGYSVLVEERTLRFRRAETTPPEAPTLELGAGLLALRTQLTALAQPNEVQVRGWDATTKQALVGKASRAAQPSQVGDGRSAGDVAQRSFGSAATVTITNQPVRTQGEANHLAQAILNEMAGDYLYAEGECLGEPRLRAGVRVAVANVGRRFGGSYFVTATRHSYTHDEGYRTTFYVNGRRPHSLLATLAQARPTHTINGVVVGIVTNNNDPDGLGRVKVKFPWLDEGHESDWARLATPGAGKERGFFVLPEVDDEVLVAFEHGDISRPYVVGGLWNGKDKPPASVVQGGKVHVRTLRTRYGHAIELRDDGNGGDGSITLKTKNGSQISISDSSATKGIQIESQGHKLILDDKGRAVLIESAGTLELSGKGGKLSIGPQGVELQSNASLKLQANAMLDLKTNAVLSIQGSLVKIN